MLETFWLFLKTSLKHRQLRNLIADNLDNSVACMAQVLRN